MLRSIREQSFQDYEVILIDDGSTDRSREILQQTTAGDGRFNLTSIENGGVSNARNIGLSKASGKWIQFLDADDQIMPGYLEQAYDAVVKSDADICFTDFVMTDQQGRRIRTIASGYHDTCDQNSLCDRFMALQNTNGFFGFISNKLFKRELWTRSGAKFPTEIRLAEDLDFYAHLYPLAEHMIFLPVLSFSYLQTEDNYQYRENIDYRTQLQVQLDIKQWFLTVSMYEKYREKLDQRISEYAYYVLFYDNEKKLPLDDAESYLMSNRAVMDSLVTSNLGRFERQVIGALKEHSKEKINLLFRMRTGARKLYRMIKHG